MLDKQSPSKPFFFISYSRDDHDLVMRLRGELQAQGINIWIDKEGIQPGTPDWEETLRTGIRASHAVLYIASPNARKSRYVKDELRLAEMYRVPVYPFWIKGTEWMEVVPVGWGGTQYIDAREEHYKIGLKELVAALNKLPFTLDTQATAPSKPEPDFEPRNPYKGLKAFTTADASDFFGRDSLIYELVKTLKELLASEKQSSQPARLLTVIGPSGSGKSSVVMAGLLPRLHNAAVPGSNEWVYLEPIVPGKRPIEALTLALQEKLPDRSLKSIREDLEDDTARGLHLLASTITKSPRTNVVLVVDQFEELFIQTTTENERRHFIDLLVTAITEPASPVIVILTLRADFYDRPIQYPELAQLIQGHQSLIFPMDVEDLRAVIEGPAALPDVQISFEDNLVGDLLFEVQGQAGALPLLQFTLDQLFRQRIGHRLTLQAYRQMGGVKGALTKQAESTYAALPSKEHRRMARALFLRLLDLGATEQDTTRRRAALSEFSLIDPTRIHMFQETIDAFIAARLLTTNRVGDTTTIEVSHEALLREWKRLSDWLHEAPEDIRLQRTISEDVAEWERHGKPRDRLYRGSQLKEAKAWGKRNIASKNEAAFLQASILYRMQSIASVIAIVLLLISTISFTGWLVFRPPPNPTVVTNTNDDGPGSLRRIIASANPGSRITFDASLRGNTIMLTSGDLNITKKLDILGPGTRLIAISSGKYGYSIIVHPNASVTISNLIFKNSQVKAESFIINQGTLTLSNCMISGNSGSIYNDSGGYLTLTNSSVFDNTATTGAGITNFNGKVTLTNSVVSGNTSLSGGGIYNDQGTLILTNSSISNNKSDFSGGGISNINGKVILTNTTVSDNMIDIKGVGVGGGGGIFINGGTLTSTNSTISDNTAVGNGGGIAISGGQANITFCTIYDNTTSSNGGGVAIENAYNNKPAQVAMRNSIVAGNRAKTYSDISGILTTYGYNLIQDLSGVTFVDPLKKHSKDVLGNTFTNPGIDSVLRNNDGPTQTHALLSHSPAIDQIPLNDCNISNITVDQRGVKRPDENESFCDIGAYESTT